MLLRGKKQELYATSEAQNFPGLLHGEYQGGSIWGLKGNLTNNLSSM